MKKYLIILLAIAIMVQSVGCGSEKNSDNTVQKQEYDKLTETFKDSYSKCTFTTRYIDADKAAMYFNEHLYDYEDEFEVYEYDEEIIKCFSADGTKYHWTQAINKGFSLNFYGALTNDEYELKLKQVDTFIDSMGLELEIKCAKETDRMREYFYRQMVNGTPISLYGGGIVPIMQSCVGKTSGLQLLMEMVIDDVRIIETYQTKDFLPLAAVNKILAEYRRQFDIIFLGDEPMDYEIIIQTADVIYYVAEESGQYVLKPVYELYVLEDNGKFQFEALYIVDVLTGYVECRTDDFLY